MSKFAQILQGKVHWIFETEETPEFASDIILVDITDNTHVQEGWIYNNGEFVEPGLELDSEISQFDRIEGTLDILLLKQEGIL